MAEQPRNQFEAFSQWLSENPILAGVVGLAVIMVFLPVKKADFAGRFNPVQRRKGRKRVVRFRRAVLS